MISNWNQVVVVSILKFLNIGVIITCQFLNLQNPTEAAWNSACIRRWGRRRTRGRHFPAVCVNTLRPSIVSQGQLESCSTRIPEKKTFKNLKKIIIWFLSGRVHIIIESYIYFNINQKEWNPCYTRIAGSSIFSATGVLSNSWERYESNWAKSNGDWPSVKSSISEQLKR